MSLPRIAPIRPEYIQRIPIEIYWSYLFVPKSHSWSGVHSLAQISRIIRSSFLAFNVQRSTSCEFECESSRSCTEHKTGTFPGAVALEPARRRVVPRVAIRRLCIPRARPRPLIFTDRTTSTLANFIFCRLETHRRDREQRWPTAPTSSRDSRLSRRLWGNRATHGDATRQPTSAKLQTLYALQSLKLQMRH